MYFNFILLVILKIPLLFTDILLFRISFYLFNEYWLKLKYYYNVDCLGSFACFLLLVHVCSSVSIILFYRREIIIRIKRENDYESLNLPDTLNKTETMNILQIKMFNYIKHMNKENQPCKTVKMFCCRFSQFQWINLT